MIKRTEHGQLAHRAGKYLKTLIKTKYRTQDKFADAFHCDRRTVIRWVRDGIPNLDVIEQLAVHFDVNALDFIREAA